MRRTTSLCIIGTLVFALVFAPVFLVLSALSGKEPEQIEGLQQNSWVI